jgi:MoxR-like ATPase
MQERQVTAEGSSHPLPDPFSVIATQNPVEYEGTYPLPEAQLDRFLLKVSVGYPSAADEAALVRQRAERGHEEPELHQRADEQAIRSLRRSVESVEIADVVSGYLVDLVRATRSLSGVLIGASPRASVALLQVSRARAVMRGRGFVLPDDVKALAEACLSHRLSLRPELWLRGVDPAELVRQAVSQVPVPVGFSAAAG